MHESTIHSRQENGTRKKRRKAAATSRSPLPFLTIPKVRKGVPLTATNNHEIDKEWRGILPLCLDLVDGDSLKIDAQASFKDVISKSISAWASKQLQDVRLLDKFSLFVATDNDAFNLNYEGSPLDDKWHIAFESAGSTKYINIKEKLEKLEASHPGLGRTALYYSEKASYNTASAWTPEVGFWHATHLHWYGWEEDADFLEERNYYCEGEEPAEDIFLPSSYKKAFPAFCFGGEVLPKERLMEIKDGDAGQVARMLLSIIDLIDSGASFPDLDGYSDEPVYFSCFLGTESDRNSNDKLIQVYDDFMNYVNQSGDGYTGFYGIANVPFDRESFLKWRDDMEKGFSLYTCLDSLLGLIGTEIQL